MVFNAFERMMAFRYLRARRKEGFVSVITGFSLLGICLGVATLIIVMSVMNGFRQELLGRILGLNGHITVTADGPIRDYDAVVTRLSGIPGVIAIHPSIEGQVLASANGVAGGALVRALKPEDMAHRPTLSDNIVAGSLDQFVGDDVVMVGNRFARKYGLSVGDKITLISPQGTTTAFGTVPKMRAFTVTAIFSVGMYEYDSGFIYMPLSAAQSYFKMPEKVTHIEILVTNPDALTPIMGEMMRRLDASFTLADWTRSNASFFNALQVERNVMFLILTLIILVAAFNIISGLIMLVKDKGRDIAILRTMGASRGAVMRIFFLAGASVGVVGTVLGLILGLLFCLNIESIRQGLQALTGTDLFSAEIYFLSKMPAEVDPHEVIVVALMALGLSLAATIYPSWRAARLDPVEALRYE